MIDEYERELLDYCDKLGISEETMWDIVEDPKLLTHEDLLICINVEEDIQLTSDQLDVLFEKFKNVISFYYPYN